MCIKPRRARTGAPAAPWLRFAIHHFASPLTLAAEAALSGSLAVLVGPSGAGKTSLLRSIAGLMRPQRGYVTVAERVCGTASAALGCGRLSAAAAS